MNLVDSSDDHVAEALAHAFDTLDDESEVVHHRDELVEGGGQIDELV